MIGLDFETEAIEGNPTANPPKPVGVAFKRTGWDGAYMSWGHPSGNSHSWEQGRHLVAGMWESREPIVFHNSSFDVAVACKWFDLPEPDPLRVHDSMFSIFLNYPYSNPKDMGLKPAAEKLLGWPPDEQDALKDWVLWNIRPKKPSTWGAYIAQTPPYICGPYAVGDVDRTMALHEELYPQLVRDGMEQAYIREQLLRPILMESERRGMRVDLPALCRDLEMYETAMEECETRIRVLLNSDFDISKPEQLCDAIESAGMVQQWVLTPTGKRSVAKDNIEAAVTNPELIHLLRYRGSLATCLQTFMRPWAELAAADGRLHPSWNQVRSDSHGGSGARTGRMSGSKPSFMNISNEFDVAPIQGLPALPLLRKYCVPEEGHIWLKRDFSSQEIRILSHFEDGLLLQEYRKNPSLDPHKLAADLIKDLTGLSLSRKITKTTAFGIIYGMGLTKLANELGISYSEAAVVRNAYFKVFPGIKELADDTKARGYANQSIRTWGGRQYFTEPPKLIRGHMRSFEYKLLNYLIQGSAADQTKISMIDWNKSRHPDTLLMAAVHDEVNISAPKENWQEHMQCLRENMDADRMDVPFQSEGFTGENWQEIQKLEEAARWDGHTRR